jgi:hypothetical protein
MSYNAYILIDMGGEDLACVEYIGTYTGNVSGMYHRAMPGPYPGGGKYWGRAETESQTGLSGISGLQCDVAADILDRAIRYMYVNHKKLGALEPDNRWGTFDGALGYLIDIRGACLRHPKAILGVSW